VRTKSFRQKLAQEGGRDRTTQAVEIKTSASIFKHFKQKMFITHSRAARILTQKVLKGTSAQLFSGLSAASRRSIWE
jgi:hypothetical protein